MRRSVSLSRSVSQIQFKVPTPRSLRKTTFTSLIVYIVLLCISFHLFVFQPLMHSPKSASEVFDPSLPVMPDAIDDILDIKDDANSDILLLESENGEIDIDTPIRSIGSRKGSITRTGDDYKIGGTGDTKVLNSLQKKVMGSMLKSVNACFWFVPKRHHLS